MIYQVGDSMVRGLSGVTVYNSITYLNYGAVGAVRAGAMSVDEKRGCLSAT